MVRTAIVMIAVVAGFSAGPAAAQLWPVGEADDACIMSETFSLDDQTTVYLIGYGNGDTMLAIENNNWTARESATYSVTAYLDRTPYHANGTGFRYNSSRGIFVNVGQDFVAQFSSARTLVLMRENVAMASVSLAGSADGVRRLNECRASLATRQTSDRQRSAEIAAVREIIPRDPFYDPANPLPPVGFAGWVTPSDYPSSAINQRASGTVRYRLSIRQDGRIEKCDIVNSSGHESLDEATCRNIMRRGRFPAVEDPQYAVRYFENDVIWTLPQQ